MLAYAENNLGQALDKKGEHLNAIECYVKSIVYADSINDTRIKAEATGGLGDAYYNLGEYDKSEMYARQSLTLSKELGLLQFQSEMYGLLSNVYEKQKKAELALASFKAYVLIRDSILRDEKKTEIARKEMQIEFERKEALGKAEVSKQRIIRNTVTGGAAVLLLATALSFGFYKRRRDAEEQKTQSDFKARVADTEMKALRLQMNPHFIFNSLNSISDYISRHDTKTADYFLTKFAKVMRMTLENSEKKEITLAEDLTALELYLELEALRMNNKFTYEIKVDDAIDKDATLIPPLILQPFVENSIWHGLSKKKGEGKITILIKKEGDMINCIVEDNGIGRKQAAQQKSADKKSFGMKITEARIDIINKIKKSKAAIELSDLAEGVRVEVRLPLEIIF